MSLNAFSVSFFASGFIGSHCILLWFTQYPTDKCQWLVILSNESSLLELRPISANLNSLGVVRVGQDDLLRDGCLYIVTWCLMHIIPVLWPFLCSFSLVTLLDHICLLSLWVEAFHYILPRGFCCTGMHAQECTEFLNTLWQCQWKDCR